MTSYVSSVTTTAFTPTAPHQSLSDADLSGSGYTYEVPNDGSVGILRVQVNGGNLRLLITNAAQPVAPSASVGYRIGDGGAPSDLAVLPGDTVRFVEEAPGCTLEFAPGIMRAIHAGT